MGIVKNAVSTVTDVSVFGWLDNIPLWNNLPYAWKGGILRALKAGLSGLIAILITLPLTGFNPVVALVITMALQGIDKAIREWKINDEALTSNEAVPTSDAVAVDGTPVNTDATVVDASGKVNTDASVPEESAPAEDADPTEFDDPPDQV